MPHSRYEALDGLRGIAAIGIVVYHGSWEFGLGPVARHGYLAVDFFFVLSGFVIALAYDRRLAAGMTLGQFWRLRTMRLYPMIAFGALLGAAVMLLRHPSAGSGVAIALGLSMLPVPLPLTGSVGLEWTGAFPLNPPFWSLFIELAANLFFAGFHRRLTTRVLVCIVAGSAVALVGLLVIHGMVDQSKTPHVIVFGLVRAGVSFFAGALIFRLSGIEPRVPVAVLAIALLAVMFEPSSQFFAAFDGLSVLVLLPGIVWLGRGSIVTGIGLAWCRRLGRLSYPLYAVHYPLLSVGHDLLRVWRLSGPELWLFCLAWCAGICAVGWLVLVTFDEPVRAALGRLRPASAPAVGAVQ